MFIGEGPGAGGGSAGPALRGPFGRAADADDPRHRHGALGRVHLQRGQVPPAAEPQSRAGGGRGVPELSARSRWRWCGPGSSCCWAKWPASYTLREQVFITRDHGRWYERKGVWFMPTFHPSALLRDPAEKARRVGGLSEDCAHKLREIDEATGVSVSDGEISRGAVEVRRRSVRGRAQDAGASARAVWARG